MFSIVCEELGFVGPAQWWAVRAAALPGHHHRSPHAPTGSGRCWWWDSWCRWPAGEVLNVAVVTNTIPNTGISLPFFSSGGTSLMMLLGR
ncbi:MAG: FtsW/RodA/SpoVE family cell cycle protein [Faecalibacterium prausnitzii]